MTTLARERARRPSARNVTVTVVEGAPRQIVAPLAARAVAEKAPPSPSSPANVLFWLPWLL